MLSKQRHNVDVLCVTTISDRMSGSDQALVEKNQFMINVTTISVKSTEPYILVNGTKKCLRDNKKSYCLETW